MDRHTFLRNLHSQTRPRNYFEIGVNDGRSLALSHVPSIAVDPAFKVTVPIRCDVHLVRAASDDFFAREDPIVHLRSGRNPLRNMRRGRPLFGHWWGKTTIDLAFIDGLHLFEFALRDFMNVERFAGPSTIIVFDDMLPRNVDEAARDPHTSDWAGDVYKVIPVLRRYRPNLVVLPMDTTPTGILVVLGADPTNTVLREHYDEIIGEYVVDDPQPVPLDILERHDALDPDAFLTAPFLTALRPGLHGARRAIDLAAVRADVSRFRRSR